MITGSSQIVIVSGPGDAHIKFVTKHLDESEYIVINPLDVLNGSTIDYAFEGGQLSVLYKNQPLRAKSVWFRRPVPLEKEMIPVAKQHLDYTCSALHRHLEMFLDAFPNAFWLSDVHAIRRAEHKLAQLTAASKLGFAIPDTLFASGSSAAKVFVRRHKRCIVKSQASSFPKGLIAYTRVISMADKLDFSNLNVDPYTFQAYIEPQYELRVTVVRDQVFAAKVSGDNIDGIISDNRDWRYAWANNSFTAEKLELSTQLAQQCVKLVERLGLQYGAIDLIVDKNDTVWFLEINPNGQWAFIEEVTGQPIGSSLATILRHPSSRNR